MDKNNVFVWGLAVGVDADWKRRGKTGPRSPWKIGRRSVYIHTYISSDVVSTLRSYHQKAMTASLGLVEYFIE